MPNWTNCKLSAIGRRDELERFRAATYRVDPDATVENACDSFAIDLERIMPVPSEVEHEALRNGVDSSGVDAAYRWRVRNWGTKWNTCYRECGPIVSHPGAPDRCSLTCVFATAWSAPMPVLKKLVNDWPQLDFRFAYVDEDGGEGCAAVVTATGGRSDGGSRDINVEWIGDDGGTLQRIREFGYLPEEVEADVAGKRIPWGLRPMFWANLDEQRGERYGHVDEAYDVGGLVRPSARAADWEARWLAWLAKPAEERERWYEEQDRLFEEHLAKVS